MSQFIGVRKKEYNSRRFCINDFRLGKKKKKKKINRKKRLHTSNQERRAGVTLPQSKHFLR